MLICSFMDETVSLFFFSTTICAASRVRREPACHAPPCMCIWTALMIADGSTAPLQLHRKPTMTSCIFLHLCSSKQQQLTYNADHCASMPLLTEGLTDSGSGCWCCNGVGVFSWHITAYLSITAVPL